MATLCFCGCGRRILLKGRIANVYGENATNFAGLINALFDEDAASLIEGLDRDELLHLEDRLKWFGDGYRDVVHGDRRLSEMEPFYDDWVATRDRALAILNLTEERIAADPGTRRMTAMGDWIRDQSLTPEEAAPVALRMDPDEFERILRDYEQRRAESPEVEKLKRFADPELTSDGLGDSGSP
jgi:hypothetical protein